jgi:hypothetical protein
VTSRYAVNPVRNNGKKSGAGRNRETSIRAFLGKSGWLPEADEVRFFAAGEYNANWAVRAGGG